MTGMWVVLVVEEDSSRAEQLREWLTDEGYVTLSCAGPVGPWSICRHGGSDRCALADDADVVLLDLSLDADTVMEGVPGWILLDAYRSAGKSVVALAELGSSIEELADSSIVVLGRFAGRGEIVHAVRSLLGRIPELEAEGAVG